MRNNNFDFNYHIPPEGGRCSYSSVKKSKSTLKIVLSFFNFVKAMVNHFSNFFNFTKLK